MAPIVFNWRHLACCDPDGTNFNKIYGRFKEIGLLEVGAVFEWHNDFGLDVSLGIDEIFLKLNFVNYLGCWECFKE